MSLLKSIYVITEQNGFTGPILRVRNGTEIFCIQEPDDVPVSIGQLITDLSSAFERQLKQVYVKSLIDCPGITTFYVLQDRQLDQSKMSELMKVVVGSSPSDEDLESYSDPRCWIWWRCVAMQHANH